MHFTGDFHDSETNTEYTQFRQLSTTQGRWLTPDPYLGSMDLTNPQSLNRYAYVMNNPMNAVDPLGLFSPCPAGSGVGSANADGTTSCGEPEEPPSWAWLAFEGWSGTGSTQSFFCMLFGSCIPQQTSNTGGGGGTQTNDPPQNTSKKLTPDQCKAAQTLLDREKKYGTTVAAWQSAIGFGDGTVEPFNSSVPGQAYANTAKGVVKVDWFTDLRLTTLVPGPQLPAYIIGKLAWTTERAATNAPITNRFPFQDPVETRTLNLAISGAGFRTLFTPEFMKENCQP